MATRTNLLTSILALGIGLGASGCASYTTQRAQETVQRVAQQKESKQEDIENKVAKYYGEVRVTFESDAYSNFIRGREIKPELIPVEERDSKFDALSIELDKYDESFLEENLAEIYYVEGIVIDGHRAGGQRSDYDLERVMITHPTIFHAEFSSIVLLKNNDLFPSKQWGKINKEFEYTKDGDEVIDDKSYNKPFSDSELLKNGFITKYATTTTENDYNTIIRYLYVNPDKLFENCDKYPKLKQKTDFTIEFLSKVYEQELDRQYFIDLQK